MHVGEGRSTATQGAGRQTLISMQRARRLEPRQFDKEEAWALLTTHARDIGNDLSKSCKGS